MMKPIVQGTSSVAWFKLAEFVMRGEKERALSIYRLLSHSLHNRALVAQLEGDLLAAFDDARAVDAYKRAIALYEGLDGGHIHVFALYQSMIPLCVQQRKLDEAYFLIEHGICSEEHRYVLRELLIRSLVENKELFVSSDIEKALVDLLKRYIADERFEARLTPFLSTIAALDERLHALCCSFLSQTEACD